MAGSFLAWAEIVPLTKRSNGYFEADCCFPVRPLPFAHPVSCRRSGLPRPCASDVICLPCEVCSRFLIPSHGRGR